MNSSNHLLQDLIRRIMGMEKWQRDQVGNAQLFDVSNENAPATLSASQNNYDPGNYDVLRLSASVAVNITGISGGRKGRFLELLNGSAFNISLLYESALSDAANRIVNSTTSTVVLSQNSRVRLYYDSTQSRWIA